MNSLGPDTSPVSYRKLLTQRLKRSVRITHTELIVVAASKDNQVWQEEANVLFAVPGYSPSNMVALPGTPLVIDEACNTNGPWAGIAGPTGERNLAELEQLVHEVRGSAGTILGIQRPELVPDVNQRRIRDLYDISICIDSSPHHRPVPNLVTKVEAIAQMLKGGNKR